MGLVRVWFFSVDYLALGEDHENGVKSFDQVRVPRRCYEVQTEGDEERSFQQLDEPVKLNQESNGFVCWEGLESPSDCGCKLARCGVLL